MEIEINGLNMHYIQEGNGPNVLLLHGWGCNTTVLAPITNLLKERYTVTVIDLPGFGKTDEPKEPFGVSEFCEFVLAFLDTIGITETILIGHSLGGQIITKMVANPDMPIAVPKIVLIGSAGARPKKSFKTRVKIRLYKTKRLVLGIPPIKWIFPQALEQLKNNAGSADYRNASEMMRKCLVKVVNEDLTPLFHLNTIDTLLIWGENDPATPLAHAKIMEQKMPKAGLAVVKNAGHYPFLEQSAVFNSILSSYLL